MNPEMESLEIIRMKIMNMSILIWRELHCLGFHFCKLHDSQNLHQTFW